MYIFCHLGAGLIIGIFLYWFFHDSKLIIPAAIGGIIPDIIDKPIGHLLLQQSLDYGRIYAHGLSFFGIIMICGILVWILYRSLVGISFSLGLLSHQLLDRMWNEPENWLYPFKGNFVPIPQIDYIDNAIMKELFNPYEWFFALLITIVLVSSLFMIQVKKHKSFYRKFRIVGFFFSICCGISGFFLFFSQNSNIGMILTRLNHQIDISLASLIMILTAFFAGLMLYQNRFFK